MLECELVIMTSDLLGQFHFRMSVPPAMDVPTDAGRDCYEPGLDVQDPGLIGLQELNKCLLDRVVNVNLALQMCTAHPAYQGEVVDRQVHGI